MLLLDGHLVAATPCESLGIGVAVTRYTWAVPALQAWQANAAAALCRVEGRCKRCGLEPLHLPTQLVSAGTRRGGTYFGVLHDGFTCYTVAAGAAQDPEHIQMSGVAWTTRSEPFLHRVQNGDNSSHWLPAAPWVSL